MKRLILLLFLIFPIIHCSCPDGFELVAAGECRMLKPISMNIRDDQATDTAISQCKALQAQPVIIHNDEQQSYWTEKKKENTYMPLGLVCNTSTLKWQWSDGSILDYKPSPSAGYNPDLDTNCKSGCVWLVSNNNGYWGKYCDTYVTSFAIYCTAQLQQPIPNGDGCESFEDDSEDGVCYQVATSAQNWKEAQTICRSFGANVASVHNDQENSFLRRLAVSKGAVNGIYLGASPSGKGNHFGWIDGSEWDYEHFYPGFPITGLGDCIALDSGDTSGQWANIDCNSKLSVACTRQHDYISSGCYTGAWKEGEIAYSPGYPFDASVPCDFILSVDPGKRVELEIIILEANSCCDHLIVHESYVGSNIIANLTGALDNTFYTTSSSNSMRVSWQPNGGVNVRGVMFTFRSV